MHGIGEKFSPDLHTGTGNFTVPIALPPGRNGFQPQLNLVYSTGNGNGPFGLGWSLSIPGVSRKTSKGIPRYDDSTDVFILSGAEDLVPVEHPEENVTRYRPRTEGLFAKILHHRDSNNDYWEVQSKDGLKSFYGTERNAGNDPAAIAKPSDRSRVFAWKLSRTVDPFGNRIEYSYERDQRVDGPHEWDQLYLSEIRYADFGDTDNPNFLVKVRFLYEDRIVDPFSEYRSGFEIRTTRRCTRIEISTHADADKLVRVYHLVYLDQRPGIQQPLNGASLLSQIRVVGHDGKNTQELPPLEFGYTRFEPEGRDFFPVTGAELPPISLASPDYDLADLFGDGLPDVLELNGTARYWRNLGGGRFDLPREMRDAPAGLALASPGVQLLDADGDGRLDLLTTTDELSGYFPLRYEGLWDRRSFKRYQQAPSFNLEDPEVKLVDLDGDGVTDAIRSGSRLECFLNDPKDGWTRTRAVERQSIEVFPNINFSDPRVKWGDMTGDGLQDIVLVFDGNVEYWPNLGHGDWGKRIHMRESPRFPDGYDPKRILVGDVDGDGLADIVYVDNTKVQLWINQSGNGWSAPITILGTPPVSDMDSVRLVDILGSGISGVLWSADAGGLSRESMYFLDFTGGLKPYLLHEMDNHIGAVTRVHYAPSTHYFSEDQKRPATRWKTPLPFPVHVVAQVEVIDAFSKGKLTTEYRYHHGYWDGAEREFRGFGRVEQLDTESFEKYDSAGLHGADAFFAKVDRQFFSPPTLTKTWFHQGPVGDEFGDWRELDYTDEYWPGDPNLLRHTETVNQFLKNFPTSPEGRRIKRDALRTLRGSILRTELFALDGSEFEERPYTVTESAYGLAEIEVPPDDVNRLRIFFPHPTAQRTTQWERGDDPMTQFAFTDYRDDNGAFDLFGRPQVQTQIACPRGWQNLDDRPAEAYLATRSRTRYASPNNDAVYIHDRVAHTTSWEIRYTAGQRIQDLITQTDDSPSLQLFGHSRNYYDGAAFAGLPLGQVDRFGAVSRSEALVLTEEILLNAHGTEVPPYLAPTGTVAWTNDYPQEFRDLLPALAGYHFHTGGTEPTDPRGYFAQTDRRRYDFHNSTGNGRGLVLETMDPLGDPASNSTSHRATVQYDKFGVLPEKVTDSAGLFTEAHNDYRVLQPDQVTDPNGNITRFTFTPLGLLASTFVGGKSPAEGDQIRPSVRMEYGFLVFDESPPEARQPIFVRTIRQIHHETETDVELPKRNETITTIEYSDGFGRLLQTRTQGEELRFGDEHFGGGDAVLPLHQSDGRGGDVVGRRNTDGDHPNVVVSGWQIYDNKGRVVEKYEPFFAEGWDYGQPNDNKLGQKVTMFYDPRGHVIRTVNPDQSEQRVIYGVPGTRAAPNLDNPEVFEPTAWEAYTYDANDNAERTHKGNPSIERYRHHFNTPTSILIDALGRTIETVERDREDQSTPIKKLHTRMRYDIRGNLITVIDALEREAFQHIYDLANRKLRIDSIDAGIRRTVLDAAGNVVEQRDSKDALILHGYDDLNRPIRLWARDGSGDTRLTLRERLEYGDEGSPSQSSANRTANRNANRLGKLTRHFDEAGLLEFVQYDFKGNVLEKTRQVVSDAAILAVFSSAAPGGVVKAFRVDWDDTAQTTLDAQVYETRVQYDALNRIKRMLYPQDVENQRRELRPTYNRAGALEQVSLNGEVYVEHIAYNAKGQRLFITYGNGVITRHAYEPKTFRLGRLCTEHYSKLGETTYRHADPLLQDFTYDYDLVGNIWQIHDRTPESGIPNSLLGTEALDRNFKYDPLYRLRSATGRETDFQPEHPWDDTPRSTDFTKGRAYTETYQYDAVGNIELLSHQTGTGGFNRNFTLVAGNNRLNTVSVGMNTFQYRYDDNGNMIDETTSRHFEWDHSDRMRVFRTQTDGSEASLHAHYLYDAGGQRLKKLVRNQGGQVTVTIYIDGVFEHHRSIQASATLENNSVHVMDNQSRIALVRVGNAFPDDGAPEAAVKYNIDDHLGSSNLIIGGATASANGSINREEYTSYGETCFGSFARKRYRFTGKERDEESGLSYHGIRYYNPWITKWLSCDPKGFKDGVNIFSYARSNPIRYSDTSGLQSADKVSDAPSSAEESAGMSSEDLHYSTQSTNDNQTNSGQHSEPLSREQKFAQDWFKAAVLANRSSEHPLAKTDADSIKAKYGLHAYVSRALTKKEAKALLDLASVAPVVGIPFAVVSAGVSASEGDKTGVALGVVGIVPLGAIAKLGSILKDAKFALLSSEELTRLTALIAKENTLASVLSRVKPVTDPNVKAAIQQGLEVLRAGGTPQDAGNAVHAALGAAERGIDLKGVVLQVEIKTHWTGVTSDLQIISGIKQSLGYEAKAAAETGIRPITNVWHIVVDPKSGEAVEYFVSNVGRR